MSNHCFSFRSFPVGTTADADEHTDIFTHIRSRRYELSMVQLLVLISLKHITLSIVRCSYKVDFTELL